MTAAAPTVLDDAQVRGLLPSRPPRGHKGTSGKLLVIAGSMDYLGAALLVTRAACRAGAGLVRLAIPTSLQPLVAGRVLEAVTIG
ncbi:MAG: NAD(P)H-hydrate dehydratase, partial [Candidatus Limnocylindrales bacterium]